MYTLTSPFPKQTYHLLCVYIAKSPGKRKKTYKKRPHYCGQIRTFHSSSLNPASTISPATTKGRFTSIPSVASSSSCSSSLIPGNLSFNFNSLYKLPLVLKNRFNGSPLFLYHSASSSFEGFSSFIGRPLYAIPFSSSHLSAFLHVEHLE